MSKGTLPLSLESADRIMLQLIERFSPYCERIRGAGSWRRGKETVNDLEIVAIPRVAVTQTDLFGGAVKEENTLLSYLDELVNGRHIQKGSSWGKLARYFTMKVGKTAVSVNIFTTLDGGAWGDLLLLRTGNALFSKTMFSQQDEGGVLPRNMHHVGGKLWRDGRVVPCYEEEDYFNEAGVGYILPKHRTDDTANALAVTFRN